MSSNLFIPDRSDLIWLDLNPQLGREQMGRRPVIVISPKSYNQKTNLALICPISTKIKSYPFEVLLTDDLFTKGVIIADQLKSLDWKQRNAEFIEKVNDSIFKEVIQKVSLLLK